MRRAALTFIAAAYAAFGIYIFIAPMSFYTQTPGVQMLGPFSVHFIRDAGLAYFAGGAVIIWGAITYARGVALAGTVWPCLHALFHLQMWGARGVPADLVALVNLFGIQLPAWLALYLALKLKPPA